MQRCASKLCAVDGQRINTNAERAVIERHLNTTEHVIRAASSAPPNTERLRLKRPAWLVHYGYTSAQPDRVWFTTGLDTTQTRPI
jgi:hypothetical protein